MASVLMSVFSILGRSFRGISTHVCVLSFGEKNFVASMLMSVFSILGRSFRGVSAVISVLGSFFSWRQCSCLCCQFWGDLFVASVLMSVFSLCACHASCSTLPALSCTAIVISLFLRLRNRPYTCALLHVMGLPSEYL